MSASPDVIHPQDVAEIGQGWKVTPFVRKDSGKGSSCTRLISGDASSSGDECNTKVRKPYTITKQRERWTESEHQKFLEALKLFGRAWRRIEEYIGTKTAVQIRSHAQKFFSKLEREASTGSSAGKVQDIEIPPPRPKRKPSHPYPKKAGNSPLNVEDESKELSALSAADCSEGHHEGFQSGSFNPYINKGLGASSAAFQRNPFVPGHFFGPQGSVKLFGKTVVVPKNLKPAAHNNSTKECIFDGESPVPKTQTNKADLQQTPGFYPFLKERKSANFSEQPLVSDRSGSCIVINPSERAGELHARNCSDKLPATYESGAVDSHCGSEGDQPQGGRVEARNIEHPCSLPQKDGLNFNVLFHHGVQQNQSVPHWINNFFGYHSGLALPPMAGHGLIDGVPNNPLTYWQFMQASAVNYAAYTAAVAAAAAAGWSESGQEAAETSQANVNEAKVLSSLGNDVNPTALPSAATSWWPHRGFMPSGYSPPMGAVHQGEQVDAAVNAHPYENKDVDLENVSSQTEHAMELGIADEAETSDFEEDDKKQEAEKSRPANSGCMLRTLCASEAPVPESVLPGSDCQHDMDATIMPAKCSTQQSDTERRAQGESPENLYSSSDEFDGQVKKQREGSSSGSNTPVSRFQSSECETLGMLESKKRDSYTLFEDNDDTCSDAFKKSHQLCGNATTEAPKVIAKHLDKGRKHQQKESRHGDSEDSKRLKSCAHDIELRKEVSEEGRKAFRALFTSKLLPQTFAAANMVEERNAYSRNETVSRPIVSRKDSDPVYIPVPMYTASGDCINPDRSPQGDAVGEVHAHGKLSTSKTCANLDMGVGCGVMKEQHERNSKSFAVSPSSGFVPYKKPLCKDF